MYEAYARTLHEYRVTPWIPLDLSCMSSQLAGLDLCLNNPNKVLNRTPSIKHLFISWYWKYNVLYFLIEYSLCSYKVVLVVLKHGHTFFATLFERWALYPPPLNLDRLVTASTGRAQGKWRNVLKDHASSALASETFALGAQNHHARSLLWGCHAVRKPRACLCTLGARPSWPRPSTE